MTAAEALMLVFAVAALLGVPIALLLIALVEAGVLAL